MKANRPTCLRCGQVELAAFGHASPEIEFFDCPACHRRYARKPGHSLTFAWMHPVSLPLYSVLFDSDPLSRVSAVADLFIKQEPPKVLLAIVDEIALELKQPTQNVRDILDNRHTEEQCREFLREFVMIIRAKLGAA